jgi:hypothetical protein
LIEVTFVTVYAESMCGVSGERGPGLVSPVKIGKLTVRAIRAARAVCAIRADRAVCAIRADRAELGVLTGPGKLLRERRDQQFYTGTLSNP